MPKPKQAEEQVLPNEEGTQAEGVTPNNEGATGMVEEASPSLTSPEAPSEGETSDNPAVASLEALAEDYKGQAEEAVKAEVLLTLEEAKAKANAEAQGLTEEQAEEAKEEHSKALASLEEARTKGGILQSLFGRARQAANLLRKAAEDTAAILHQVTSLAMQVAKDKDVPVSWLTEVCRCLSEFRGKVEAIVLSAGERESAEQANWRRFKTSSDYQHALRLVEMQKGLPGITFTEEMGQQVIKALFDTQFQKPYKGGEDVLLPLGELQVAFTLEAKQQGLDKATRDSTVNRPASNGSSSTSSGGTVKARDLQHPEKEGKVDYEVYWEAYQESGEHKDLIPASAKGKPFYAAGGHGSTFVKSLEETGKIGKARGFLQSWAKAQKVTNSAGEEVSRFETYTEPQA